MPEITRTLGPNDASGIFTAARRLGGWKSHTYRVGERDITVSDRRLLGFGISKFDVLPATDPTDVTIERPTRRTRVVRWPLMKPRVFESSGTTERIPLVNIPVFFFDSPGSGNVRPVPDRHHDVEELWKLASEPDDATLAQMRVGRDGKTLAEREAEAVFASYFRHKTDELLQIAQDQEQTEIYDYEKRTIDYMGAFFIPLIRADFRVSPEIDIEESSLAGAERFTLAYTQDGTQMDILFPRESERTPEVFHLRKGKFAKGNTQASSEERELLKRVLDKTNKTHLINRKMEFSNSLRDW